VVGLINDPQMKLIRDKEDLDSREVIEARVNEFLLGYEGGKKG
jgi:hypothetical protein